MLTIKTYLAPSANKGIGVFSSEHISSGTTYWVRSEDFDKIYINLDLDTAREILRTFIKTYGFLEETGNWYVCVDNARFCNHSENPNTRNYLNDNGELAYCTVVKDIYAGEEILCNYRDFCCDAKINLNFKNME